MFEPKLYGGLRASAQAQRAAQEPQRHSHSTERPSAAGRSSYNRARPGDVPSIPKTLHRARAHEQAYNPSGDHDIDMHLYNSTTLLQLGGQLVCALTMPPPGSDPKRSFVWTTKKGRRGVRSWEERSASRERVWAQRISCLGRPCRALCRNRRQHLSDRGARGDEGRRTGFMSDLAEVCPLDLGGDPDERPPECLLGRREQHLLLDFGIVGRPDRRDRASRR